MWRGIFRKVGNFFRKSLHFSPFLRVKSLASLLNKGIAQASKYKKTPQKRRKIKNDKS